MKEKHALILLKILKYMVGIFTGSFLVMYFDMIATNNITLTATYYSIVYAMVALFIYLFRNIAKGSNKMNLIRLGVFCNFAFLLSIGILKEELVHYIWIPALLYGFSEASYYSIYNTLEAKIIDNRERSRFVGWMNSVNDLISIVFPFLLGSGLSFMAYDKVAFLVLIFVVLQFLVSFQIKEKEIGKERSDLKKYFKIIHYKRDHDVLSLLKIEFLRGFTIQGAFATTVILFTISVFHTNFRLGVFNSIFALIGMVTSFVFGTFIKKKHYRPLLIYTSILTVICLVGLALSPSYLTVILYNFCQCFSIRLLLLMGEVHVFNIANKTDMKSYHVEYFVVREGVLGLGRVCSYLLLLFVGFFPGLPLLNVLLLFYILVIVLLIGRTIALEKETSRQKW